MTFTKQNFYYFGETTEVLGDLQIHCPNRIYVGDNGIIGQQIELSVADIYNRKLEYNLKLNDWFFLNSTIKIEVINYIEIGKYVIIGPQVYISDVSHEYNNFRSPIKFQGVTKNGNKIFIKDGSWIGAGARVIGNVTIGYGAVVGANAVVTKSVPDHAVVVGVPAQVIRICDYRTGSWVDVRNEPNLLQEIIANRGVFAGYNLGLLGIDAIRVLEKQANTLAEENKKIQEFIDSLVKSWLNFVVVIRQQDVEAQILLRDNLLCLEALQKKIYTIWDEVKLNNAKAVSYFQYINETLVMMIDSMSAKKFDEVVLLIKTHLLPGMSLLRNHIKQFVC